MIFNNETWISAKLVHHAQTLRGCLDFSHAKLRYMCDTNRKICQGVIPIFVSLINMFTEKSFVRAQGGHVFNDKVFYLPNAESHLRQQPQTSINKYSCSGCPVFKSRSCRVRFS